MDPQAIEKLIDNGRDGYEARLAAGQARQASGDLDRAIAHFEAATAFKPGNTMAWQALGRARHEQGDDEQARTAWERGLAAAQANGDKQSEKVLAVWLRRLERAASDD
ncbi:tetratricopeptide repeat protein [Halomonas denitrificans]|nr:tetratricopeptide repeat protein [Halomonas denitrificans]